MQSVTVALFLALTAGHLGLTGYWVRRLWRARCGSSEEWLFHATVISFGSLQAVLHVLACTVGISLLAGGVTMVTLHLLVYWSMPRSPGAAEAAAIAAPPSVPLKAPAAKPGRRQARERPDSPALWEALLQTPWLTVIGTVAITTLVLSWWARAPQSLQILGIDSRHYHAPYAVNYGHGLNIFGYLATPHVYPVAASILGAWFFQAFSDPLLLDLVNLLPFLLLLASFLFLFRLLTGKPAWEWVPLIFLLLFTGKMFRVSLFISADLLYAASFAAVFTALCSVWIRGRVEPHDWLSLSFASGLLVSSKIQGFMSEGLLVGCFVVAVAVRLALRRAASMRFGFSVRTLLWSVAAVVTSGGIWLIRNWLYFGSPMAPAGLTLFGVTIFQGPPAYSDWLSIAKDMRDIPGYNLPLRFLVRSREWMGAWPAILTVGYVALLVERIAQLAGHRRVTEAIRHKLFVLAFFAALFAIHCAILIPTHGTSIEILMGQTVRYIIPFFALYPLLGSAFLFSDTFPWVRTLRLKWVLVLPALVYLVYDYNRLTQMPIAWNRMYGAENLLDYRLMLLAVPIAVPWCVPLPAAWARYRGYVSAAAVGLACIAFVPDAVITHGEVMAAAQTRFKREWRYFASGGRVSEYRGTYWRLREYQRTHGVSCRQNRLFVMSRFDYPLELQDPAYDNLVLDMQNPRMRHPWFSPDLSPGDGPCDYVIAASRDSVLGGETRVRAVSEEEIRRALQVSGRIAPIGDSGSFRVYAIGQAG